jgi:hypothetical protein
MTCALISNLKTAKVLGLTMPPHILFQADAVMRWTCHMLEAAAREVQENRAFICRVVVLVVAVVTQKGGLYPLLAHVGTSIRLFIQQQS